MTASVSQVQYTQAIAKGGSLLQETRILLATWEPGETESSLAERVLSQDLLGRATARRVLDIVRVYSLRYLFPDDSPARHLKTLLEGNPSFAGFADLLLFYTCRRDPLLRDFLVTRFWPAVRDGQLVFTNRPMQQLIAEAEHDGRIPKPWSEEIKRDMAGRVMIALTDLGLLRQIKPATREVIPYRVSDEAIIYIAYLLHDQSVTDSGLAADPAWSVFGLLPEEVRARMERLSPDGWFVIQRAGALTRITWTYQSVEEAVDALAR